MNQAQERKQFMAALANLGTGTYSNYGDMFDWSSYDSIRLAAATPEYRLFSVGLGEVDPVSGLNKTLADTNMRGRTITPKGSKLLVQSIRMFFNLTATGDEDVLQAYYDMLSNLVLNISIFGKDTYGQWGLDELFTTPVSLITIPAVAGDNDTIQTRLTGTAITQLKVPIVLASQTTFDIIITPSGGATDDSLDDAKLKVSLRGVQARLS